MRALVLVVCSGCSSLLGIEGLNGPAGDDDVTSDAPIDVVIPETIRITGTVSQATIGMGQPLQSMYVSLVRPEGNVTSITDPNGRFDILVETGGVAVDGVMLAQEMNGQFRPTHALLAAPLVADTEMGLLALDQASLDQLSQFCNAPADPMLPFVVVTAVDHSNAPVAGVTIATSPEGQGCVDTGGVPQPGTRTQMSGRVFMFNLPAVTTEISAGPAQRVVVGVPGATMFVPVVTEAMP